MMSQTCMKDINYHFYQELPPRIFGKKWDHFCSTKVGIFCCWVTLDPSCHAASCRFQPAVFGDRDQHLNLTWCP